MSPGDWAAIARLVREAAGAIRDTQQGEDGWVVELWRARQEGDVARLRAALREPRRGWLAATFLAQLGASDGADDIAVLLNAPDRMTRVSSARALGQLDAHGYDEQLRCLAQSDESEMVRRWTARAVGESGSWPSRGTLAVIGVVAAAVWWRHRRPTRAVPNVRRGRAFL
jgi:hypothetical protein